MDDPKDPFALTLDDLDPVDMDKPPLLFPGVYAFVKKGKPVYVGQSGDIPRRYAEHQRRAKWFSKDLEFKAIWVADMNARWIAETVLILKLVPLENRAIKIGIAKKTGKFYSLYYS